MVEKYYNSEGKVGVLISSGYGAGWSTWEYDYSEELLFDKTLVEMFVNNKSYEEIEKYVTEKWPDVYTGGLSSCEVVFIEPKTKFKVEEYDGAEYLVLESSLPYEA